MGFFDWLTGKKNAPAANSRVNVRPAAPAANMMVAAPPAPVTTNAPQQFGGRKRTRKATRKGRKATRKGRKATRKGRKATRKGRKATRKVQRGGCTSACWEPRLRKCVC